MTKCHSMSVISSEAFCRRFVLGGFDERLLIRLPASETVETNLMIGKIDFGTDQAMGPEEIKEIFASLNFDLATSIGATQVDHCSLEWQLVVGFPVLGKGTSRRSGVDAWCRPAARGNREAVGTILNGIQMVMNEALPNLLLPAAVEALDDGLEPGLMGWCKDRDDAELQTEPDHTAKGIRKLTCSAKNGVVVELGVFWQTVLAPVCNECFGRKFRGPGRSHPGTAQSSVQTDAGQNVHVRAATEAKIFDEIEAIDIRLSGSDMWQIPAFGSVGGRRTR